MPFTLIQAGSSLQIMNATTGVLTTLTMPTGVTMDSTKVPRFTVFGRYVIVVNSPSRPITVDADGIVRVLTPRAPRTVPVAATSGSSTLSGTYLAKQSFLLLDGFGNIIAESELGPPSNAVTIASAYLKVSNLDLSPDQVTASRLYRTTTNGSTYFPWLILDGNTQTTVMDNMSDASLQLVTADVLGGAPDLVMIKEFRERLWGKSRTSIDDLRYTDAQRMYAWPSDNVLKVPREGSDDRGITGIITRRDSLAVARQDVIYQIMGDETSNFALVKMKETVGVESEDSIQIHRDTVYFLARDGVYEWSDAGVKSLSDGKTRNWFCSDTYFNRARLRYAVGSIDPITNKYKLLLSAAGSSNLDRWVEYDIESQTWWGPHKTGAFTPSFSATILDGNSKQIPIIASTSGFVWKEQTTRTDSTATAIEFDVDSKFFDGNTPDIEKLWLQPSLVSKIQAAGTLVITPKVGDLAVAAGPVINADMTLGRERLRRLGNGRYMQLNFTHGVAAQDVEIFGVEIPFHELGRR